MSLPVPPHRTDAQLVAKACDLPFVDLDSYEISPGMLRRISSRVAIEERCVPMVDNPRRTVLVVDDPARIAWLATQRHELGLGQGREIEFALASTEGLDRTLSRRLEIPDL